MGRTALALVDPVLAAQGFGKEALQRHTLGHLIVDAPINGQHVVFAGDQGGDGCGDGFLAGHRPVGELELAAGQPALDRVVHFVNARQLAINFLEGVGIYLGILWHYVSLHG